MKMLTHLAQRGSRFFVLALPAAVMPLLWGCQTTGSSDVHQFDPLPKVEVGATELKPVDARPVTDLLRDAEKAFAKANEAQERGDNATALEHYTLMLELLLEADMDPAIFYSLRDQFGDIIDHSNKFAKNYGSPSHRVSGTDRLSPTGGFSEIQIPFPLPERVLVEIEEIQNLYPRGFQIGLNRSYQYMPYIQEEFRKAGLPEELGWICMVESQFTPKIVSRAGAGGMWQFMRTTGKRYHLRIDNYVDERYNWKSATHSAIAMLTELHAMFDGDWALAISAYNMGEGGLERAIAANGGMRDYWQLLETPPASNRIRRETKKYYPRFLATLIVASNPERYGFTRSPNAPDDTTRVPVKGMYALEDLDRVMKYPSGTLAKYNPDLIQGVTPPTGEYNVSVPVKDRRQFVAALTEVSQLKSIGGTHKVRRGETLSQIARRYGVSHHEIMRHNRIRSARHLQVGQTLKIPGMSYTGRGGTGSSSAPSSTTTTATVAKAESKVTTYTVRSGDTLSEVADRHGVRVQDLQTWNKLGGSTKLTVGQKLAVYGGASSSGADTPAQYHVVKAGEYPAKIARAHGIALDEFLSMNGMSQRDTIHVGQRLMVNGSKASSGGSVTASAPTVTKHQVARGETASTIAEKHGVKTSDLLAWNNLTSRSILRPGQELTIQGAGGGSSANNVQTHTVARGHNPTTIARRYGVRVSDLYKWNNWPRNHVLQIGDQVVILK
jgi:membrane-bound lytic murein transglycosylase D